MESIKDCRRALIERVFARLNDRQKEAVFHKDGALLILAGAGSGKTTVIIQRILNLIQFGSGHDSDVEPALSPADEAALRNAAQSNEMPSSYVLDLCAVEPVEPWKILAITFTNKAAGELKDRLKAALGPVGEQVTAGTFHSFCARILRQDAERLGYSARFLIYDSDDQKRLMKACMKDLGIDDKTLPLKSILGEISRAKDSLRSPEDYAKEAGEDYRLKTVAACYALYQKKLREADAMDFDDLLCNTVELLRTCPDVLDRYHRRFEYLLVDEYQDTNHAQYELIHLLAQKHGNLCVVGDDDQSIYQFRGATIENILSFEQEFPHCTVIRLEQNYRSTGNILDAANGVIAENQHRKGKTLWTDNGAGEAISRVIVDDEDAEARFIADTVLNNLLTGGRTLRDHVVLYRANAQSNAIERAFIKIGVPYRIVGGHRFFDAAEVRDSMAYLRLLQNPDDNVSLRRIINTPKRGIGDTTLDHASALAEREGISLYNLLSKVESYPELSRSALKIRGFIDLIEDLRKAAGTLLIPTGSDKLDPFTGLPADDFEEIVDEDDFEELLDEETPETDVVALPLHEFYTEMLQKTGYLAMWQQAGKEEEGRVENLKELESSIRRYEEESPEDIPRLSGFLEEASLMTDADNYDAGADVVTMMTMHAAKGLEFPVVFLPGFEEGVFPGTQSMFEPQKIEEERRLCYVAMTRAKERLYLLSARSRMLYGQTTHNPASRFLNAVPAAIMETDDRSTRYGPTFTFGGGDHRNYGGDYHRTPEEEFYSTRQPYGGERHTVDYRSGASRPRPVGKTFLEQQNTKKTAVSKPAGSYAVGDTVRHPSFGDGKIVAASPMGSDTLLSIEFPAGVKKLMANYAKLEKL